MTVSHSFEDRFARICAVTRTSRECDLAQILGIRAPSVGGAKKRRLIPLSWVERIALRYNVSADWILFGRGSGTPLESPDVQVEASSSPEQHRSEQRGTEQNGAGQVTDGQTGSGTPEAAPSEAHKAAGFADTDRTLQKLAQELQAECEERRRLAQENRRLREEREELNQALDKVEEQLEFFEAILRKLKREWEQEQACKVMQKQEPARTCEVVTEPEPAPVCEIATDRCRKERSSGLSFSFEISWGQ